MIVPGAVLELNASYVYGGQPGLNSPLTTLWSDLSGSANDATLVGFAGNSKSGWGGSGSKIDPSCCVFDGLYDYITVPELNLCSNGSFSYEVVFCLDNLPLVSIPGTLFSESANGIEYSSLAITETL